MVAKNRTVIVLNGFFKWFFCGCEAQKVYVYKDEEEKVDQPIKYDDLTIIEGIGPVIKNLLNKNNIYSFENLSEADVKDIEEMLDGASLQYHEPTTWPKQAQMAVNGEWQKLEKWQDELDGGKEK